ncbi:kinase-like domain-containing protein [Gorgonomyces haynaldii]|nr:kinase-like domain-containing protein [Gorgonomyces haynaldii]
MDANTTTGEEATTSPMTNAALTELDRKRSLFKARRGIAVPSGPKITLQSDLSVFKPTKTPNQPKPAQDAFVKRASQYLLQTYLTCNANYSYQPINNPRRVLTKPSKPAHNDGHDNEHYDYILYVNDIIGSQEGHQYQILDLLGQGTFGQVVKCQNIKTKELMAWKVIKNKPAYYNQSLVEVAILEMLNKKCDPDDKHHLVRMKDHFVFRNHLCIGFEMLSVNLYELIKQNQFRGLSTNLVKIFVGQILESLSILNRHKIIHCDLKPENILLKGLESPAIKVIDFGSACHENQTVYTYIQSRFYRSPEVLLGLPYTSNIDMWSLGCIAAEIFLGLPLFPGTSEYNQMSRIVEMLGLPPTYMLDKGKQTHQFFDKHLSDAKPTYTLKSMEKYMQETKNTEQPSKRYFKGTTLQQIIMSYPIMRKGLSQQDIEKEMNQRRSFVDFLSGVLQMNPLARWSPDQARKHPFITGEPFNGPFIPQILQLPPSSSLVTQNGEQRDIKSYRKNSRAQEEEEEVRKSYVQQDYSSSYRRPSMLQAQGSFTQSSFNPGSYNPGSFNPGSYGSFTQASYNQGSFHQAMQYQRRGSMSFEDVSFSYDDTFQGHPRYGDFGERQRIPSRMPSVSSEYWEPFQDDVYGRSSRQSSLTDMSWTPDVSGKLPSSPRSIRQSERRSMGHNRSLSHSSLNSVQERDDVYSGRRPSMPQSYVQQDMHRYPSQSDFNARLSSSLSRHSMLAPEDEGQEIPGHRSMQMMVGSPSSRAAFPISPRSSQSNLFGQPVYRTSQKRVQEDPSRQESLQPQTTVPWTKPDSPSTK